MVARELIKLATKQYIYFCALSQWPDSTPNQYYQKELILGLRPANERRRYKYRRVPLAARSPKINPVIINDEAFWHTLEGRLTHWGRDKMAAIFQTTFSNAFSRMMICEYRLKFYWSWFLGVQLTISQHGSNNGLVPTRRQAIIWTNDVYFTDAHMHHSVSRS